MFSYNYHTDQLSNLGRGYNPGTSPNGDRIVFKNKDLYIIGNEGNNRISLPNLLTNINNFHRMIAR